MDSLLDGMLSTAQSIPDIYIEDKMRYTLKTIKNGYIIEIYSSCGPNDEYAFDSLKDALAFITKREDAKL